MTSASIGPHSHLVSSLRMPCRSLTRVQGMLLLVSPISQSVLRQVHSHYQSEFSTQRDLALPLSVSSIFPFSLRSSRSCLRLLPCLAVTSSPTSIFPSIMCFPTQGVANPISLPSFYYMYDIPLLLDSM